ncbi:hypothetical protein BMS3Abin07_01359 [bacterium BMS3Abin07]|nr:hypothetical protein BMS3Abin07_01359 [bacterium BMS3Abin07]GBE32200.1 hypothetical protein BMS3Bbin05_01109 [bacterium BMS3Bbin05]
MQEELEKDKIINKFIWFQVSHGRSYFLFFFCPAVSMVLKRQNQLKYERR